MEFFGVCANPAGFVDDLGGSWKTSCAIARGFVLTLLPLQKFIEGVWVRRRQSEYQIVWVPFGFAFTYHVQTACSSSNLHKNLRSFCGALKSGHPIPSLTRWPDFVDGRRSIGGPFHLVPWHGTAILGLELRTSGVECDRIAGFEGVGVLKGV